MKHFVGILAHKSPLQLQALSKRLEEMNMAHCFHWDQNSGPIPAEIAHRAVSARKVYRGHYSLVQAALDLLSEASKQEFDYFHLISGEDIPVKTANEFELFFTKAEGLSFINYNPFPIRKTKQEKHLLFADYEVFADQIPLANYKHYFLKEGFGMIKTKHFKPGTIASNLVQKMSAFRTFQRIYHKVFKADVPDQPYAAGSAWFSIHKSLAHYLLNMYTHERKQFETFSKAYYPDELVFQTLAINSPFKDKIVNSDLRYIKWAENEWNPTWLGNKDLDEIQRSNAFFARKWDRNNQIEALNILKV